MWERLLHAYGKAVDTPGHLEALEGSDEEAIDQAFHHLWSAVLHQGTIYPATAPVVAWLCAALRDGRLAAREQEATVFVGEAFRSAAAVEELTPPTPERRARLERAIAGYNDETEAKFWRDDDLYGDLLTVAAMELRGLAPGACHIAEHLLERDDTVLLTPALDLLVQATHAIPGADPSGTVRPYADHGPEHVRVTAVLALGEFAADTSGYLDDDSLAVRVAAALAPAPVTDERARQVLRDAALDPEALERAFEQRPPAWDEHARFHVIGALCRGAADFDELLSAALAFLPLASAYTVQYDWGAFLAAAQRLHPDEMTEAKRTYLAALVKRKDLWDPTNGNAGYLFKQVGLPYDRKACRRLAKGG